jgi:hypothetical protein
MNISHALSPQFSTTNHYPDHSEIDVRCCGWCWRSRPKVKAVTVDENYKLRPCYHNLKYQERIIANQRLAVLLSHDIRHDPIKANRLFDQLRDRVNFDVRNGDQITPERLVGVLNVLYELKLEEQTHESDITNDDIRQLPDLQDDKTEKRSRRKSTHRKRSKATQEKRQAREHPSVPREHVRRNKDRNEGLE